jgi:lipopolysaccharide transport system ATP-binding protein
VDEKMNDIAVKFENVSKFYKLYNSPKDRLKEALHPFGKKRHREFYALKNINLEVKKGEILGIVGRNGSGKSTLLKIIAGVVQANSGRVIVKGEISALLELASGMNPDYNGIQNIYFGGIMMGFSREEMKAKIDDIIAFADIGDYIHQPLKTYSSGMRARLGFSLAINISPEILVVDEVLSVGDDLFKRKCFAKMEELFKSGCTVFFVSHSSNSIVEICTRAILLDEGEIILDGTPKFVTINYDRLLFGNPTERQNIRKELMAVNQQRLKETIQIKKSIEPLSKPSKTDSSLFAVAEPADIPEKTNNKSCIHEAVYLSEFQSMAKTIHKTANINLVDVHISTTRGKKVNSLFPNESYFLNYTITFNDDTEDFAFACVFKSEKGLVLSGVRYPPVGKTLDKVIRNTTYSVKLKFKCSFLPGNYYLDIGIVGFKTGEKQVLSAEYDSLVFKVQKCKCLRDITSSWAYFSLEPEIEISRNTTP